MGQENRDKVLNLVTETRPSQPNKSVRRIVSIQEIAIYVQATHTIRRVVLCCADADSRRTHMASRKFIAARISDCRPQSGAADAVERMTKRKVSMPMGAHGSWER